MLFKCFDGDALECPEHATQQHLYVAFVAVIMFDDDAIQPRVILFVGCLPGLALTQCWVLVCHRCQTAQDKVGLDRHRLFAPQRAVVVIDRNARLGRHIVGTRFVAHLCDKLYDCPFGWRIIPRCQVRCHFNSFREESKVPRLPPRLAAACRISSRGLHTRRSTRRRRQFPETR